MASSHRRKHPSLVSTCVSFYFSFFIRVHSFLSFFVLRSYSFFSLVTSPDRPPSAPQRSNIRYSFTIIPHRNEFPFSVLCHRTDYQPGHYQGNKQVAFKRLMIHSQYFCLSGHQPGQCVQTSINADLRTGTDRYKRTREHILAD